MNPRAKTAAKILAGGLALGVLGDALLRATPWGVNAGLWMLAALGVIATLVPFRREALRQGGAWLVLPALIFSAGLAWRGSQVLAMLNFLALGITASLALLRGQNGRVVDAGLSEYALGAGLAAGNAAFGALPLAFSDVKWKELSGRPGTGRAFAFGRGVLLAVPALVIFGALFASADAVFKGLVQDVFHFDLMTVLSHIFLVSFFAWTSAGWLRGAALGEEREFFARQTSSRKFVSLGILEIGTLLSLIDLLFLVFVIVQVRYLFGGAEHVQATTGLTYAEYARSGFFQLVAVVALALPLMLAAHWLLRKDDPAAERIFRALSAALVLLLFVIVASAIKRMLLYQSEYGLTQLRIYTTAFMAWLGVVLIWFSATVLRGQRKYFAVGALVAGFAMIVALEVLNPDALIVRTNVARALEGRRFDPAYVSSLSADAVPDLVAALPSLTPQDRCGVAERLLHHRSRYRVEDWRTWNYARAQADPVMDSAATWLGQGACNASSGTGQQGLPGP